METNKKGACAIPHLSLQRRFASSLFLVIRSGLSVYKSIKPSSNLPQVPQKSILLVLPSIC